MEGNRFIGYVMRGYVTTMHVTDGGVRGVRFKDGRILDGR